MRRVGYIISSPHMTYVRGHGVKKTQSVTYYIVYALYAWICRHELTGTRV